MITLPLWGLCALIVLGVVVGALIGVVGFLIGSNR